MRYTLYRLKTPYGEPEETILETDYRQEMVEKVSKLIFSGVEVSMLRMVEDKSIQDVEYPPMYEGVFD
ncbi:MAG: hypothetical protein IJ206_09285 [Oscillospiraceae bacterium]|nr:hypothetical protein [Oscillospiraceae bacterium]